MRQMNSGSGELPESAGCGPRRCGSQDGRSGRPCTRAFSSRRSSPEDPKKPRDNEPRFDIRTPLHQLTGKIVSAHLAGTSARREGGL
jgi:hypothetical protein